MCPLRSARGSYATDSCSRWPPPHRTPRSDSSRMGAGTAGTAGSEHADRDAADQRTSPPPATNTVLPSSLGTTRDAAVLGVMDGML